MPTALGTISLTFDDALHQHLDYAIPLLDSHELAGTFYMHLTAETFKTRREDWVRAARSGHELGNHTIFHPATEKKGWVRPGNALESYSLDRMSLELQTANDMLQCLDGETERTFAFPCSNPVLGRYGWPVRCLHAMGLERTRWPGVIERAGCDAGSTRQSYEPILKDYFVAARGGGLLLEQTPPAIDEFPRFRLLSAAIDGHHFATIRDFVQRSMNADTWAILQFHGIHGGHHMDCALQDFRDLVHWLADHYPQRVVTIRNMSTSRWTAANEASQVKQTAQEHHA